MIELEKFRNLNAMLDNAVRRFPDKTSILMEDRQVSFARLDEDSNRVAHALIAMGVKKGDRVAMMQASNPEFVIVFFGIMKAGAIAVPLDSRYIPDELDRIFADCRPEVLVIENPPLESLLSALPRFDSIEHVITFGPAYAGQFSDYNEILSKYPSSGSDVNVEPEDIAIISYTGGPTQKPHGVALSHYSVSTEAVNSAYVFRQTDKDVLMQFALPMYHQFGLTSVLMASIYKGSTVAVVPGTGRSIDSFMETVERLKGTMYMGVPYIYALMINVARREGINHDLSSLRLCASGGAPLEPPIIRMFKESYGMNIIDIWGQTETVSHATVSPIDGSGKIGYTGKPMPCWEIKIFDENDNELPPGQDGEIVARGPVMAGFYNKPEATAEIMRTGWLHTGDIGHLDEEGSLCIIGRKRRMLILKGQNIFPEDIEDILSAHPKIADVRVRGITDIVRGETVKALVKLKPGETATEQEIRQYCQGRMADYKLPRDIEFVDKIPDVIRNWKRPDTESLKKADIRLEGTG
ncbi:MAG: AMP-binding protein [Dehalococcoidales bacterium]|nr:AMP-binding protein [Dehalococcoidales bacterium]